MADRKKNADQAGDASGQDGAGGRDDAGAANGTGTRDDAGMKRGSSGTGDDPYLVLARKYRPSDFSSLIGQGAMVQTFSNAFKSGRIHHAFILTGVRGVGKTTTARILARAFNYENEKSRRPTLDFREPGLHCKAIIEGRHVDVIEMDAASNTGIDDIREIIDSVKYAPSSAPYKVYIIDEVHMLSRQAFNGLLKTLEEPPPYVKFIFATTEIRSVPVTVLSRCQRFDLKRVDSRVMMDHLVSLLKKENIEYQTDALAMIIRAGEGSVRDCLSLADQAIAHGDGRIVPDTVKAMLGLADRATLIDLFEALLGGRVARALELARTLYDGGVDPVAITADLAAFTHLVSRIKIVPASADDISLSPDERLRGREFSEKLGMRVLTRTWQILQQGMGEIARSGDAIQALEMVLIRLAHASDLPTPDQLVKKLQAGHDPAGASASNTSGDDSPSPPGHSSGASSMVQNPAPAGGWRGQGMAKPASAAVDPVLETGARPVSADAERGSALPSPASFAEVVELALENRDLSIRHALENDVRLISFAPGHLEIALTGTADRSIVSTLAARLKQWTGENWLVSLSNGDWQELAKTAPTLREIRDRRQNELFRAASADDMVVAVMNTFPGARLVEVNQISPSGSGSQGVSDDEMKKSQDEK